MAIPSGLKRLQVSSVLLQAIFSSGDECPYETVHPYFSVAQAHHSYFFLKLHTNRMDVVMHGQQPFNFLMHHR